MVLITRIRFFISYERWINLNKKFAVRSCSSLYNANKPPTFVTTPIFYVNSVPHIGHLYTTVYADAIHRFSKLTNPKVEHIFCTGTDEHGLKVQKAAQANNKDAQSYCNEISAKFFELFKEADIDFTHFNRTTNHQHIQTVTTFWNILLEKGFIYKSKYKGYYSINDECFVSDNLVSTDKDGRKISLDSGHPVEWHEEENYMFRLSLLQDKLVDWIHNRVKIKPDNFYSILKADAQNPRTFKDISISRVKSRLQWGIEVPNDPSQVIYVWFDALVNYLTPSGFPGPIRMWPSSHIIGKEILKFHAIYWPAFLIAADLEPPKVIYCHSHWLCDDHKMSKSKGNVIDPNECISKFTTDGIRYFLLKEGAPHSDSNFNMEKVKICLNSELANNLGNLLNRCISKKLNPKQIFPRFELNKVIEVCPEAYSIVENSKTLAAKTYDAYLDGNFYMGISYIMDFLRFGNAFINATEPWKLTSSMEQQDKLEIIVFVALESIRVSSILLQPVIPQMSTTVLNVLNIKQEQRSWEFSEMPFCLPQAETKYNNLIKKNDILFSKIV